MNHLMLKAKLHLACVTHAELNYEGSCAIDSDILEQAGLREYEQIHIYNKSNGNRFVTYIIKGKAGSKMISMNGAAARLVQIGDRVIICAYSYYSDAEVVDHCPNLIYLNEQNIVTHTSSFISEQQ